MNHGYTITIQNQCVQQKNHSSPSAYGFLDFERVLMALFQQKSVVDDGDVEHDVTETAVCLF